MIKFKFAYDTAMEHARRHHALKTRVETVPLEASLGRILAADIFSDMDFPPFNKSAVDGYACKVADLEKQLDIRLEVLETIPAGAVPARKVGSGQCSKIMTGAMVPEGADLVLMVETTALDTDGRIFFTGKKKPQSGICLKGEDGKKGEVVLPAGTRIAPEHVAVLASVGCVAPLVSRKPLAGIISTGDEIVEPSQKPGTSQIRNSNSSQLYAQAMACGAEPRHYGIAKDNEKDIHEVIKNASAECDVILLTGGVSMGDFDHVPAVLKGLGFEIIYDRVAIKPGKPTTFAVSERCLCFGLPGNPATSYVIFELLVKPFLFEMMGHTYRPKTFKAALAAPMKRRNTERDELLPVRLTSDGTVAPVDYHGSAHIQAMTQADGFVMLTLDMDELKEGTLVDVRQL